MCGNPVIMRWSSWNRPKNVDCTVTEQLGRRGWYRQKLSFDCYVTGKQFSTCSPGSIVSSIMSSAWCPVACQRLQPLLTRKQSSLWSFQYTLLFYFFHNRPPTTTLTTSTTWTSVWINTGDPSYAGDRTSTSQRRITAGYVAMCGVCAEGVYSWWGLSTTLAF